MKPPQEPPHEASSGSLLMKPPQEPPHEASSENLPRSLLRNLLMKPPQEPLVPGPESVDPQTLPVLAGMDADSRVMSQSTMSP